jgi:hypothetical protein
MQHAYVSRTLSAHRPLTIAVRTEPCNYFTLKLTLARGSLAVSAATD